LNLSELEINERMNHQNGKPYFVFPKKGSQSSNKLKSLNDLVYRETIPYYVKSLSSINLSTNSLYVSQIKCGACSKLHNNYEFQNGIHLDIGDCDDKKFSLYDCFDQSIKINILNNEKETELQEWKCDVCKEQFPSNKSFIFWNLPKVLIIFLKRFRAIDNSGNFVKNKRVVDIPQILNMKKYVLNPEQHTMYKLTSAGCHIGSLDNGHYYSMIKKNSVTVDNVEYKNVWFSADDDVIDPLNKYDFNDHSNLQDYLKNAYILIYTHK
jgi:ubiquitin C-terminal hydrolase